MFRLRLAPLVIALGVTTAEAQSGASIPLNQWQHTIFGREKGPPVAITNTMSMTSDGYLWAGTGRGLLRFDGVRFTVMDSTILYAANVGSRAQETQWFFGRDNRIFEYRDGQFVFRHQIEDATRLLADASGRIWYTGARFGFLKDGVRHAVPLPSAIPGASIIGIESDTGSGIWIGTRMHGVWHYSGGAFLQHGSGNIRALLHASDGALWTVGQEGPHPHLWRFKDGAWTEVRTATGASISPRSAVEGPDGSVWIPGGSLGLLRWKNGKVEQLARGNGLAGRSAFWATVARDGTVWVSTDGGLERLRMAPFLPIEMRHGLPDDVVRSYSIDHDGAVWNPVATAGLYVHRGGLIEGRPGPIRSELLKLPEPATNLASARAGGVWVTLLNGIMRVRPGQRTIHYGRAAGLPAQGAIHAFEAVDGALWLRLFGGEFGRLRNGKYRQVHLPGRSSTAAMTEDGRGRIWIASMDAPEMFVIAGDSLVTRVKLPGQVQDILAFADQGPDTIWAAGDRSLIRIIDTVALAQMHAMADGGPAPSGIEMLDELDGVALARSSGGPRALQLGPDGRIWFSTPNGFAVTHEYPLTHERTPPVVRIEEMTVGGNRVNLAESGFIPPNPEKIAIHFTATGPGLAERMRIEYRLVGADRNWVASTPPRVATYDQLRPGRYTFEVRAWNEWGIPSATTATLSFRVQPAWFQSNWFLALCVLAVAAIGGAIAHAINIGKNRRAAAAVKARYEAVLAERTRLARELHDTLLQGFTGLTLQIDGVRASLEGKNEKQSAELSTILARADRTLRDAREMVWDMRQASTDAHDLGQALRDEGEALANPGGVELEYLVTGAPRALAPTVVTTILRIAREAMVNALNHARARHITVKLAYEEQSVELEVRDDGCGADMMAVETAAHRGHWGVAGMRERARSVGGSLSLNAIPGGGTRVGVQIVAPPEVPDHESSHLS